MNKAFWNHFKHFRRLLGKICLFLTPSKTDGRVPSQQSAPTTLVHPHLLGSFPGNESPDITGQFGCGHREISALQWGIVGGGGRVGLTNSTYQLFETLKNQIPSDILNCLFPSSNFTFQGHIIFSKSPSQRKIAWRTDILRNRSIGCPWLFTDDLFIHACLFSTVTPNSQLGVGWHVYLSYL